MKVIEASNLVKALENALAKLGNEKEKIDALNIFPVPDGDTGTNMLLTYTSGIEQISEISTNHVGEVMKKFSRGLLFGARGNSGVILSQIFRGFAKQFEKCEIISSVDLIRGFVLARDTAYKAVMNPVEGTILTVISDIASALVDLKHEQDINKVLEVVIESGERSLANTPNLLPVLKEAGVVDSGGYGLMTIFSAFKAYFDGEIIESKQEVRVFDSVQVSGESTEFGYCTEFIISLDNERANTNKFSEDRLKQQLSKIGDSLVVVFDDDIVKIHVHTLVPGEALNIGQKYGEFLKLKIENMTVQHEQTIFNEQQQLEEELDYAIIAVSSGTGISNLFKEYGATHVIEGGQTMNPSTNDFVDIILQCNAKNIIILPNNSNIILAANQVKDVVKDINVAVVQTKSVIQGLVALSFFNSEDSLENNCKEMTAAYEDVKYGEVTYAVRNTTINDVEAKEGEFIAIYQGELVSSRKKLEKSLYDLLNTMVDEDASLITVIYGEDVSKAEANKMKKQINKLYPKCELHLYSGIQSIYYFFVGVE